VAAVENVRFFEHPLNHLTLDIWLRLYAYPAGSREPVVVRQHILTRTVRLGGLFTPPDDFLARLELLLGEQLDGALQNMLPGLPRQAPQRPIQAAMPPVSEGEHELD
jgi:hypothetical protein